MRQFDKDKLRLSALDYAEKNKIVNEKSINAFIAGFTLRDKADSDLNLELIQSSFHNNFKSWETDCGYADLRNDQYQNRKLEGHEARNIEKDIISLRERIAKFNEDFKNNY